MWWDTNGPYSVEAIVTPGPLVDTNAVFVFWNTDGGTLFRTAGMIRVTGDLYGAQMNGQPVNTRVRYFYEAAGTNGLVARDPANAPMVLRESAVVAPANLVLTGFPAAVGTVSPWYCMDSRFGPPAAPSTRSLRTRLVSRRWSAIVFWAGRGRAARRRQALQRPSRSACGNLLL